MTLEVIKTEVFMGVRREVLVVYPDPGRGERCMIYTAGLGWGAFERFLRGIEIVE